MAFFLFDLKEIETAMEKSIEVSSKLKVVLMGKCQRIDGVAEISLTLCGPVLSLIIILIKFQWPCQLNSTLTPKILYLYIHFYYIKNASRGRTEARRLGVFC